MFGNATDAKHNRLGFLRWLGRRVTTEAQPAAPLPPPVADEAHPYVLWEVFDRVLLLTLNDPSTRNSLSRPLATELLAKIEAFEREPELKVLVLTGADPAFCSGFNVGEFAAAINELEATGAPAARPWDQLDPAFATANNAHHPPLQTWDIVNRLMESQKPIIAAVNGPATGLGLGMSLCCDIRVASERALFMESFVKMAIPPGDGSAWALQRIIGLGNAMTMQLTGDPVDAAEAYRMGLVSKLVPHDQVVPTALQVAARIAEGSSYAHSLTKMLARKAQQETFTAHLLEAQRAFALAQAGDDHKEGVRAFLEKRKPQFK